MSNLKKISCKKATFFILEGELISVNNGEFPITYFGLRFEDAPDEQIWVYEKSMFGFFGEEGTVVSSHITAENMINDAKNSGLVNLVDDYVTISDFEEDYKPYGSTETVKRSTLVIVKTI